MQTDAYRKRMGVICASFHCGFTVRDPIIILDNMIVKLQFGIPV